MTESTEIKVNASRLWQRIETMAQFGATPAGGCNRQALTREDQQGRDQFVSWCREAGLSIRVDPIGNIFARRPGSDPEAQAVLTGSHLDTQPSGGRFDGIYGVLAGLEIIETMNDLDLKTHHPVELVVWTNEEGCRFETAMMGSAVWSGNMTLAAAEALTDAQGVSVAQALNDIGYQGEAVVRADEFKAAFELHIEQGPVLEAEDLEIGVVTAVQHMSRFRIRISGQEAHAGPTPMSVRKDPMMALARFLPEIYALAERYAPEARVTFGEIQTWPGSNNTVPGLLDMTMDLRHPDRTSYDALICESAQCIRSACDSLGLPVTIDQFWEAPGVNFAPQCIAAVERAVSSLDYSAKLMCSGAGHDACNVAAVVDTSMIFVPCEGGLSHNELESISRGQAARGANVLLRSILNVAGVTQ